MPKPTSRRSKSEPDSLRLGIRPGDKVAILAEGSNAWIISELGLFYAGAISVPLSVKLEESNDLLFRMRHAEVKAVFVSKHQLPKIRRIRAELPQLEQVIVLGHIPLESGETAYGTLKRLGRDYLAKNREEFLKIRAGDPERRLRDDHLHVGHDGRPQGRGADAPQLHGQRRTVAVAHRHSVALPDAHHPAAGPLFRACRGILHHDRLRRLGGHGSDRGDTDGDAQKHSAEHPRGPAALPAVGACAGQEFPQGTSRAPSGPKANSPSGSSASRFARHTPTTATDTAAARGWRIVLKPFVATVRRRAVPQGPRGVRRQHEILRRRRGAARFRVATLLLRHRHPDVPGIRAFGSHARHLDQFAQASLAPFRLVGQDTHSARPEDPRRSGPGGSPRTKGRDRHPRRERHGRILEESHSHSRNGARRMAAHGRHGVCIGG